MMNKKAFTLVELMVAFSILTIMILSFYPILMTTNKVTVRAQDNFHAEIMAQNALEEILHQARVMTPEEFNIWFMDYEEEINTYYLDYSPHLEFYYPTLTNHQMPPEIKKLVGLKILLDDLILYESQVWLVYGE